MSFYQALQGNTNSIKYSITVNDLECNTINGVAPASTTGFNTSDILIKGALTPLEDSGVQIIGITGSKEIRPTDANDNLLIRSPSGELNLEADDNDVNITAGDNVNITSDNDNVNINSASNINIECNTGTYQNNAFTFNVAAQNNINLNCNNTLTIQVGANQVIVSTTAVEINCGNGMALKVRNNNGGSVWDFNASASDSTTYLMPASNGVNGSVLTNDGTGVLSWVGGA